jgi:hypothetical protein
MFLYRRGIFIIDMYILYSSYDFRFTPRTQCFSTDVVYLLLTGTFCIRLMTFVSPQGLNVSVQTSYIYLLLTGTFCIHLMTFVSPQGLNVSVQTWYIYY